jgi:hypothetical protein
VNVRKALIIANGQYEHEELQHLLAPAVDAEALARVLGDPRVGGFDVRAVFDQPAHAVQAHIEDFFVDGRPDDVLVLHFSCHGMKNESGELFFAARNTRPNRLGSTATSADFVQRCMRASRSRRIVLLLDCCYGGAFSQGVAVRAAGDVNVLDSFPHERLGGGRGRAVITASSSMEYAFEGNHLADSSENRRPSLFTAALVEGLDTGNADRDEDGWVSLNELYDYVFDRVREQTPHQTPSRDIEMQGELYLARSRRRRIRALPVPPDLRAAISDPNMFTRLGAVSELGSRLASDNLPAALGASEALAEIAQTDIEFVAKAARSTLRANAARPAEPELHFGRIEEGSPSPHRIVDLLGPPVARICEIRASEDWIRVQETDEGLDISIDTTQAGIQHGRIDLKGPTGDTVLAIDAEIIPRQRQRPQALPEDVLETGTGGSSTVPMPRVDVSNGRPPLEDPSLSASASPIDPSATTSAKPGSARLADAPEARSLLVGRIDKSAVGSLARHGRAALLRIISVIWVLVPIMSGGLLAPILFVFAAARLNDWRLWLAAAIYASLWVAAIWSVDVHDGLFGFLLLALIGSTTTHAALLRRRIFYPDSPHR